MALLTGMDLLEDELKLILPLVVGVVQLPHLHHLYTPVPDKHPVSGVDVLEDGLG